MDITLTLKERLLLANQYLILEKLYPDEAEHYAELRKVVERGYALEYIDLVEQFSEELSKEDCLEVHDILDMHRALHDAYGRLEDKSGINADEIRFQGFDANEETRQYVYVGFLLHDQKRWSESNRDDLNKPWRALPRYRKMLTKWGRSADRYHLIREDIVRIISED